MIHTPTHRSPARRRVLGLGIGAVLAATAISAGPAMASTQSTCTYNTSNKNVIVTDNSAGANLRLLTQSGVIRIEDGAENIVTCRAPNVGELARVTNTDRIAIFAAPQHVAGGYLIDQNNGRFAPGFTPEADRTSEIEITLNTTGVAAPELKVTGTPGADVISVGTGGRVNFAFDLDADVEPQTKPERVVVTGGVGNDALDSHGGGIFSPPADLPVNMQGDAGNDSIVATGKDNVLLGGFGDDSLFSANGIRDGLSGGPGFDKATTDKSENIPFGDIEQITVLDQVGRLRLAPAVMDARAGTPAQLNLSWKHPKAWKQLRTITLRLSQGADVKGTVTIRPKDGRMRGHGAVKLIARNSTLSHSGKTVTARLALRLSRSLAGQDLRVAVQATDRKGHTQLEPHASVIRVAE